MTIVAELLELEQVALRALALVYQVRAKLAVSDQAQSAGILADVRARDAALQTAAGGK